MRCAERVQSLALCDNACGGAGQTVASLETMPRKVRAPQGTVPGNAWAARADGKCNRKIPPNDFEDHLPDASPAKCSGHRKVDGMRGKGEMVR